MRKILFIIVTFSFLQAFNIQAKDKNIIVVAADGSGDVRTITDAVKQLPMFNYGRVIIYIKNGVYNEKVRIERDNITFRGEEFIPKDIVLDTDLVLRGTCVKYSKYS